MTVVLAIAVLVLAAGSSTSARRPPAGAGRAARPRAAIQEAAQEATSRALADLAAKSARPSASATPRAAEEALDKRAGRDQEPDRADRQGSGADREARSKRRGETDLQTRTLLEQMGQTIGNLNSRDRRAEEGAAPAADPRPVGRAAAAPLRRDRRHDRARRLRAAGDAAHRRRPPAPRRPLPAARGTQLRRRLEGAARRLPRRPGVRGRIASGGSTSSATPDRRASTSAASARRTTRGSSTPARCPTW